MPLLINEVIPGTVAILETAPLVSDPRVSHPLVHKSFRSGPFLCVSAKNGQSMWLALTTQKDDRGLRLRLRSEWLLEGSEVWRNSIQYVSDARQVYCGPDQSFVVAGANELPHQPHNRPQVSQEGVNAAIAEMRKYGKAPI